MDNLFGWSQVFGADYISESSVSFHKEDNPDDLRRMEMLLYDTWSEHCNH